MTQIFYFDIGAIEHAERFLEQIPSGRYYDHRALLIADQDDLVLLNSPVDPAYIEYLNRHGLGPDPSDVFAMSDSIQILTAALRARDVKEYTLLPYAHHQRFSELAAFLGREAAVRVRYPAESIDPTHRYSSKAEGRRLAQELGIPVPDGILMETDARDIARVLPRRFSSEKALVIKGMWGAGGSETKHLAAGWSGDTLLNELSQWDVDGPLIIEESIGQHLATNVMLRICEDTGGIEVVGLTNQLIGAETYHLGNSFPCHSTWTREITEASIRIAEVLRREGFSGYGGVDFMEALPRDGISREYWFLEINARVNASLHPLVVTRKLNEIQRSQGRPEAQAFVQLSFFVEAETSFAEVRESLEGDAFDPRIGRGAILYSPDFLNAGSLFLMLLGRDTRDLTSLRESASSHLSAAGVLKSG